MLTLPGLIQLPMEGDTVASYIAVWAMEPQYRRKYSSISPATLEPTAVLTLELSKKGLQHRLREKVYCDII